MVEIIAFSTPTALATSPSRARVESKGPPGEKSITCAGPPGGRITGSMAAAGVGAGEPALLRAAWGATLVWGGSVPGAALQTLRVLAAGVARGERPMLVATGGSSLRGAIGFVSAALELAEQVRAGALPAPRRIFVPVRTGFT